MNRNESHIEIAREMKELENVQCMECVCALHNGMFDGSDVDADAFSDTDTNTDAAAYHPSLA